MGRPARVQLAGACYLITLEGNNRQDLFLSNQDRRHYLALLRRHKERWGLKVYAYCLMGHTAKLLLETPQANLSAIMQSFNTLYTKYFNGAHNTTGHVFSGRYKALIVDKESLLADVATEVHLEPSRAGLREKPWRYPWSSLPAYVESGQSETLVDSATLLKRFGKVRLVQSLRYLKFVKDAMRGPAREPRVVDGLCIGDEAFAAKVRTQAGRPAAPAPGADPEAILAQVAQRHGIDRERLLSRNLWRELTAVRREAILLLWREAKLRVTDIARIFSRTPSAISQVIHGAESSRG